MQIIGILYYKMNFNKKDWDFLNFQVDEALNWHMYFQILK